MLSKGKNSETMPPDFYTVEKVNLIPTGTHAGELLVEVFTSYPYSYQSSENYYFAPAQTEIEDKVDTL